MTHSYNRESLVLIFGILGNIMSFLVFLSPIPTFYKIYQRKSIGGFHSLPYFVALFSSTMYLYYGCLKDHGTFIILINSFGIVLESFYLIIYVIYAPREIKVFIAKMFLLFNIGLYGTMLLFTLLVLKGSDKLFVVGILCSILTVSVFVAPLSIMASVVRTRSVEFMPFWLSFFLTLSALMWFFYGYLTNDYFIEGPNIIGLAVGMIQLWIYTIIKNYMEPLFILPGIYVLDMAPENRMNEIEIQQ